jgi:hypothetical protein
LCIFEGSEGEKSYVAVNFCFKRKEDLLEKSVVGRNWAKEWSRGATRHPEKIEGKEGVKEGKGRGRGL